MAYHLKHGYRERPEPEYWVDETGDTVWQPDVYLEAAALADRVGAATLIDVGCGTAAKLAALHPGFDLVGVDYGQNIRICRETYPFGLWLEADFDADAPIPVPDPRGAIVICSDVIEHVRTPERLLGQLRRLLYDGAVALILTTPERELRRGRKHAGPPPNPAHTREWALGELRGFMRDEGLEGYFGLTRTNDREPFLHTIFAVIPGSADAAEETAIERWWEYRERWEATATAHETLLRAAPRPLGRRVVRRLRRLAGRAAGGRRRSTAGGSA
jgi:SAM-dependent methyltransferase